VVPTNSILRTPRPPGGAQRARGQRESAVRWFRQDPCVPADQVLADYDRWLDRQALAARTRTRTSYRRWVGELVEHLAAGDELKTFLAPDGEHDRRAVLGDWRRRLVDRGLAPSTVNLALAAATSLLDSRALPAPRVPRVELDPPAPRALSPERCARCRAKPIACARAATARSWNCCCAPACGSANSPTWTPATCA
jgi:hypothetical protein